MKTAQKIFALVAGTKSGSFSFRTTFEPQPNGQTVIVRKYMRDELLGNWAGAHGQPETMTIEAARKLYAHRREMGDRPAGN